MTGTSLDGIDFSLVRFHFHPKTPKWEIVWEDEAPYSQMLRTQVLELQEPGRTTSLKALLQLHIDLGIWYAEAISAVLKRYQPTPQVIANHGQTVAHFPRTDGKKGITLQLGDGTQIVTATGLTVIQQFRLGDMAAFGQGAPLVPRFHPLLIAKFTQRKSSISIHNLGGMSNFSYFGPKNEVIGFDTGPANAWIDQAVSYLSHGRHQCDAGGLLASKGQIDQKAVDRLLKEVPFFQLPPPKSTGRDDFPFQLLLSAVKDHSTHLISTATALTAQSIAQAYQKWILGKNKPLHEILFCGGGAKNPVLLAQIAERLPKIKITSVECLGLDSKFIEAQAFAYFGYLALLGQPIGGSWTGAKQFGPPAQILPGENWKQVRQWLKHLPK